MTGDHHLVPCVLSAQVHILLRQGAQPTDCLKAAFSAHVFLHMLDKEQGQEGDGSRPAGGMTTAASSSSASTDAAAAANADASSKKQRRQGKQRVPAAVGADSTTVSLTGADLVRDTWKKLAVALPWSTEPSSEYYKKLLERSKCAVDSLYTDFARQADKQGWRLGQTMLNPKESRLLRLQLQPLSA